MLVDRPVEECGMEAFNTCRPVTKLTPSLVPKQTCRDVPRETCSNSKVHDLSCVSMASDDSVSQVNPRRVRRPVIRRVCRDKDECDHGLCGPPGCEACADSGNTEVCDKQYSNCQFCSANTCKPGL